MASDAGLTRLDSSALSPERAALEAEPAALAADTEPAVHRGTDTGAADGGDGVPCSF